jgi:TonB family protein
MRRWLTAFAVHWAMATGGSAQTQTGSGCPPVAGEPYALCQVDVAPRADSANPPPRYPAMLRQANVSGVVRVAFVIDSAGRILTPSLRVLHTRHDLFAVSVKNALRSWRFTPAEEANRRVAVNYEYEFVFTVPPDSIVPPELISARHDTTGATPRLQIGAAEPEAATAIFTRAELLAAQRTALDALSPRPPTIDGRVRTVTLCLTLLDRGAPLLVDDATVRALELPNRRVVTPTQCPRTMRV